MRRSKSKTSLSNMVSKPTFSQVRKIPAPPHDSKTNLYGSSAAAGLGSMPKGMRTRPGMNRIMSDINLSQMDHRGLFTLSNPIIIWLVVTIVCAYLHFTRSPTPLRADAPAKIAPLPTLEDVNGLGFDAFEDLEDLNNPELQDLMGFLS